MGLSVLQSFERTSKSKITWFPSDELSHMPFVVWKRLTHDIKGVPFEPIRDVNGLPCSSMHLRDELVGVLDNTRVIGPKSLRGKRQVPAMTPTSIMLCSIP